jgi:sec-independent protein translocase protein TatA
MPSIGWPEILVIILLVVLLFGARKIPDIGKGIGEGIRNFRKAFKGEAEEKGKNQESEKEQEQKS